jgi:hypothetical protein
MRFLGDQRVEQLDLAVLLSCFGERLCERPALAERAPLGAAAATRPAVGGVSRTDSHSSSEKFDLSVIARSFSPATWDGSTITPRRLHAGT